MHASPEIRERLSCLTCMHPMTFRHALFGTLATAFVVLASCAPATTTVHLYFYSESDLRNATFENPVEVEREVDQSENAMDAALRALFAGPTDEERARGARTSQDLSMLGTAYIGVRTEGSAAIVNFAPDALGILNSAAARQLMAKAPIEETLMSFPGVTQVQYAIDGEIFDEWDA